jgi:predicted S18 family serine protease
MRSSDEHVGGHPCAEARRAVKIANEERNAAQDAKNKIITLQNVEAGIEIPVTNYAAATAARERLKNAEAELDRRLAELTECQALHGGG